MYSNTRFLNSVILSIAISLPVTAVADNASCLQAMTCNPLTIPQVTKKPTASKKDDLTNLATLIRNLNLTQDQDISIYQIVQKQTPEVNQNMKNLEQAQSLLRNMALNKQYDETVARILTQTIADSTANLAILQAQREFELFSMLSPEQAQYYNQLMAKSSN
jgi:Spy/CpxP family protein refolding chaperone